MDEDKQARQAARERLARLERARSDMPRWLRKQGYNEAQIKQELEKVDQMAEVEEDVLER